MAEAHNVVAELRGSDRADEVVMLGAHFDTWHSSPNASDNTSGVAVMLEAMRILKAVGATPRRTIRIALWSGQEQGLWGSHAYVREHFGDPNDPAAGKRAGYDPARSPQEERRNHGRLHLSRSNCGRGAASGGGTLNTVVADRLPIGRSLQLQRTTS